MKENIKYILILLTILISIKIVYLLFAHIVNPEQTNISYSSYKELIFRNDSGWYKDIAEKGYPEIREKKLIGYSYKDEYHQSAWAFFPAYPYTNRIIMKAFNTDYYDAAFISSILFSGIATILLFLLSLYILEDKKTAMYISAFFLVFPFSYYLSMMYTEALYICLVLGAFVSVKKNKKILLALLLIPLILVRPNGIIILIPLYLFYLEQNNIMFRWKIDFNKLLLRKNILNSLYFLTAPLAFALFCYYQYLMTGYYNAFSIAQAGWYRTFMFPLFAFFRDGFFPTQFNSVYTIILIVLSILSWKKLPISLNIFIWLNILLPLTSGSVTSMHRFSAFIFPLFIIWGKYLYQTKLKYGILGVLFALQIFFFYFWVIADPLSF